MSQELIDQKGVMAALVVLRNAFPAEHPDLSEGTASVWYAHLAGFTTNVVMNAAMDYDGPRFPSRQEFVDFCRRVRVAMREQRAATAALPGVDDPRCPACLGTGWELLSTEPTWVVRDCPRGCLPPLPPITRARALAKARAEAAGKGNGGPRRVIDAQATETTRRITGERF